MRRLRNIYASNLLIDLKLTAETRRAKLREVYERTDIEVSPAQTGLDFLFRHLERISAQAYKDLMEALGMKPKAPSSFVEQVRSRGDLLVLPDPGNLGVQGQVAWMRPIWQVPIGEIAIKTSEISHSKGERLARLDSPFRYRLTQAFAQVFSDIGLPNMADEIEAKLGDIYGNS